MSRQAVIKIIFIIIVPALLIAVGWFANDWYRQHDQKTEKRIKLSGFNYISPLIDVELPEGYNVQHEPIKFEQKVKNFVDQQLQSGNVKEMSVYYRDLSDGPWFGINEKVQYNPASMMKVAVMIAWLKRVERDASVLQHKFVFHEKDRPIPEQSYKPKQTLKDGASYTVDELLRYMINFSDNRALSVLHFALAPEELTNVLNNMDVINTVVGEENSITAHGFSGFFRVLYNASFLNKEMSEKALKLMSSDDFPYGISAGVPKGTRISSKFGEYLDEKNPAKYQLHEFGIVYHPKGPYILGILTRGNNWKIQADIIKSVSEIVYDSVNSSATDGYKK